MFDRAKNLRPKNIIPCADCKTEFLPTSSRNIRCKKCAPIHNKKRIARLNKAWRIKNHDYRLEYAKKIRRKNGAQPFELRERANRKTRRNFILSMFENKCILCGYNKCTRSLHIHHKDPKRKTGDKDYQRKSFKDFDNLIVLCSNCHFEVHDGITPLPTK